MNISKIEGTVKYRSGKKTGMEFLVEYRKDGAHFIFEGNFKDRPLEEWFEQNIIAQELRYLGWGHHAAKILAGPAFKYALSTNTLPRPPKWWSLSSQKELEVMIKLMGGKDALDYPSMWITIEHKLGAKRTPVERKLYSSHWWLAKYSPRVVSLLGNNIPSWFDKLNPTSAQLLSVCCNSHIDEEGLIEVLNRSSLPWSAQFVRIRRRFFPRSRELKYPIQRIIGVIQELIRNQERDPNPFGVRGSIQDLPGTFEEIAIRAFELERAATEQNQHVITSSASWGYPEGVKEIAEGGITITPLVSSEELRKEGREMNHCVGGFSSVCLSGRSIIASIKGNVRATVELDQELRIVQLFGPNNSKISDKNWKKISKLLQTWNIPS